MSDPSKAGHIPKDALDALILKGGGIKALCFAGALEELEPFYTFDCFVGTSAGAVAAVLLASGYDAAALARELDEVDLSTLIPEGWVRGVWQFVARGGVHSGRFLENWLDTRVRARLRYERAARLEELPKRVVLFAAMEDEGIVRFDSAGDNKTLKASFAAQCSAAIPGFFILPTHEERPVMDGGLLAGFPLEQFVSGWHVKAGREPPQFLGLYLGKLAFRRAPGPARGPVSVFRAVVRVLLDRNEKALVLQEHRDQVIAIDPEPIGTTQFTLSLKEKKLLRARGRLAALNYLVARTHIPVATRNELFSRRTQIADEVTALRSGVRWERIWTRGGAWARRLAAVLMTGIIVAALFKPSIIRQASFRLYYILTCSTNSNDFKEQMRCNELRERL